MYHEYLMSKVKDTEIEKRNQIKILMYQSIILIKLYFVTLIATYPTQFL